MQRKSRPALALSFIWKVRAKMENKTHISSTALTLFFLFQRKKTLWREHQLMHCEYDTWAMSFLVFVWTLVWCTNLFIDDWTSDGVQVGWNKLILAIIWVVSCVCVTSKQIESQMLLMRKGSMSFLLVREKLMWGKMCVVWVWISGVRLCVRVCLCVCV